MANRKLTHQEFIEQLSIINPDITVTSEYNGMHEKIECRCNCGHEWTTSALSLANGHGYPKRFDDCRDQRTLPFDFYLPKYNLCIEYQGSQHYMPTRRFGDDKKLLYRQKHDHIKREYCRDKGINLLEIPYTNLNSISQILTDVISTGSSNLLNTKLGGVNTWQNQSA